MARPEHITNPRELARYLYAQWAWFMRDHYGESDTRRNPAGRGPMFPLWEKLAPIQQLAWEHAAQQAWQLI